MCKEAAVFVDSAPHNTDLSLGYSNNELLLANA